MQAITARGGGAHVRASRRTSQRGSVPLVETIRRAERIVGAAPGEIFNELSEKAQAECRADLRDRQDRRNKFLAYGDDPRQRPKRHLHAVPAGRVAAPRFDRREDALLRVSLPVAFEILVGDPVPHSGMVPCPAPDHEDRRPSCHVADRLFHCFSCGAAGSLYDLGALIFGIPPRGESFFELRERLALALLGREEPA